MSTHQSASGYRLYPAYCFRSSPTYDVWVKLTASDVQSLRSEPDFPGQHLYFYLNHPIRYVRLVGAVVAIDDINIKYTVLTVDDGSGVTVEIKIIRLTPDIYNPVESPSNTVIENVNIVSRLGVFEVTVDDRVINIGTVINAKCTISEFRGQKQLEMKRVRVVRTTNEEAQAWAETAAFKRKVLSVPWRITSGEHKQIAKRIKANEKKMQEMERLKAAHEADKQEKRKARKQYLAERELRIEKRQRKEAKKLDAGALI